MNENDKNSGIDTIDRVLGFVAGFILFGVLGALVGLFSGEVSLHSDSSLIHQLFPFILGFGLIAGVFSYFFPKPVSIILSIITFGGFNN